MPGDGAKRAQVSGDACGRSSEHIPPKNVPKRDTLAHPLPVPLPLKVMDGKTEITLNTSRSGPRRSKTRRVPPHNGEPPKWIPPLRAETK